MARRRVAKLGIFGGTFNPIHVGHLLVAQDAFEQLGLDRVLFIPAASPPHKRAPQLAASRDRLRMIQLAIRGHREFAVDDRELRRGGRSYSIDTLAELRRELPCARFSFIIGADSLAELDQWREIDRLARWCTFVTLARPGARIQPPPRRLRIRYRIVDGHPCEVSSTEIRRRVARGESIRYLVPAAVVRYIQRRKLYR